MSKKSTVMVKGRDCYEALQFVESQNEEENIRASDSASTVKCRYASFKLDLSPLFNISA
jgi:hypothetical protein